MRRERSKPDIILLDIEMPEIDGLAALPMILKAHPASKVIVISTLTQRNAEISLKCLSLGAVDYLAKPESARAAGAADDFRRDLMEKLRALGEKRVRPARILAPAPSASTPSALPARCRGPCCRQAAMSADRRPRPAVRGRWNGFCSDLKPALASIPVLIVQHMPAMFTAVFAEHLQSLLGLPAREARDGDAILPGTILVAPGGRHMGVVSSGRQGVDPAQRRAAGKFLPPCRRCAVSGGGRPSSGRRPLRWF